MITVKDEVFFLNTQNTSYIFGVTKEGLLEHFHYGKRVDISEDLYVDSVRAMREKVSHAKGTTVNYEKNSYTVTEDMLLEVSGLGKGDFREPFVIVRYGDGSITSDFIYESARVLDTPEFPKGMPSAIPDGEGTLEQLEVVLKERVKNVRLRLIYTVIPKCDVLTRRAELINESDESVVIKRLMSTQLDIDECGLKAITFGGNWGREMTRTDTIVEAQTLVNATTAGISSNRSNPFMMLTAADATEEAGDCYGFNLVYSGNHCEMVNVGGFYKTRFLSGINPTGFEWVLESGESFETPEAVMTFSAAGFRGISLNMQHFVKRHIVRGYFKDRVRPILLNSWEAAYFNISESRILSLAKKAKEAGVELLVMDDGWFKGRNDDTTSLGDWTEDKKKLPGGIEGIAAKVHDVGLDFGVWVEPEMISENSDLFRAHPEYAMRIPGRDNSPGRNQMILDLTNPEVREYVKSSMKNVIGKKGVNYIKWDMNRMFSDVFSGVLEAEHQQETAHRYVLGLYEIVKYLTEEFPEVLFENCASGGNRFDLGMTAYMPQTWGSDDSDAFERTRIQTGYSYGYPMSTVTSHVSACPNHQTLRNTPLDTRFNVAAFGVFGYEINLGECSSEDFKEIKAQIETMKEWREVFFFGDFYRVTDTQWMVVSPDKRRAVTMIWDKLTTPNNFYRKIKTAGLDESFTYHVYNIKLKHNIKQFGSLVNQVSPVHIRQDSFVHNTIAKFYKMDGETEDYTVSGALLNNAGIKLKQAFGGTGFDEETRLFKDFSSRMYFFEKV